MTDLATSAPQEDEEAAQDENEDPLFAAIRRGDQETLEDLMTAGDDGKDGWTTKRDDLNRTPLMAACQYDNTEIVACLLDRVPGGHAGASEMMKQATVPSRNPAAQALLKKKSMRFALWVAGVNIGAVPMRSHTPLVIASEEGHLPILQLLVQRYSSMEGNRGLDLINQNEGSTALRSACVRGHLPCVEWLLEQGADASLANAHTGTTPLLGACVFATAQHDAIVEALFMHRTPQQLRLNQARTGDGGLTACIAAAARRNPHILQLLIQHGADVNAVSGQGWTALDHAIMRHAMGIQEAAVMVDMLLQAGAKARPGTFWTFSRAFFMGGGSSCLSKLWPHRVWKLPPSKTENEK